MKYLIVIVSIVLCGCHVPTRVALEGNGGRSAYNIAIQKTNNEELLLNLVRLKYYDAPFFLELGNVTTQFTYKAAATPLISIPGFSKENPFSIGGEFSWQNQPTISYSPLEGQEFSKQLLQPIQLSTLQQLVYGGWDIDRVFRLIVENLDDLPNSPMGTGPTFYTQRSQYEKFYAATKLMKIFQMQGKLQLGVAKRVVSTSIKDAKPSYEEVLQISFPQEGEESKQLKELLSEVEVKNGRYIINLVQGFTAKGNVGIMSRSLLSCFYYLGQSVNVPNSDVIQGRVASPDKCPKEELDKWQEALHSLMEIKWSNKKPPNAYMSIKYRDYWFYISDNDLESKRTFILLQQLFNLQAAEPKKSQPILSLPLG
jgi:hypothetical protein